MVHMRQAYSERITYTLPYHKLRDFFQTHSKTYKFVIFSKSSIARIYYVSHNDFCTNLKIINCTFRKKWGCIESRYHSEACSLIK